MTAEKVGIKSVLRTPVKSFLFLVLAAALSAFLTLGMCVYDAVNGYLEECNDYYHTIAELEYMGVDYPDRHAFDKELELSLSENSEALSALLQMEGVYGFDSHSAALGIIPGVERTDTKMYDIDAAVFRVSILLFDQKAGGYVGIISECYYSVDDNTDKMVFIRTEGEALEKGKKYLLAGSFFDGSSSYLWFMPKAMKIEADGQELELSGIELLEDGKVEEDDPYLKLAVLLANRNNGFKVQKVTDMATLRPWQQGELVLLEGRSFTEEEYRQNARSCIVPEKLLTATELTLGDTVELSINEYEDGLYTSLSTETAKAEEYTIVGVYSETESYADTVFIPVATGKNEIAMTTGYVLGQFRLNNDLAGEFMSKAKELLPAGYKLSLYDEGYKTISEPYKELKKLAVLFLAICVLVIFTVLIFYNYLFISRRKDVAQLMLALGSGKAHVFRSFLAGSMIIMLPALGIGLFTAVELQQKVLEYIADFVAQYNEGDLSFSSSMVAAMKVLEFNPSLSRSVLIVSACVMVVFTLLLTFVFTKKCMDGSGKKPKSLKRRQYRGTTSKLSGSCKYMLLAIRRVPLRTAAVLGLCLVMGLFLGILTSTKDNYRNQLDEIQKNTVIRGFATDYMGEELDGMVVKASNAQKLYASGLVSDICLTRKTANSRFLGISKKADGTVCEIEPFSYPETAFAEETLSNQLAKETPWISANGISNSPVFYYTSEAEIKWFEGYDENCFKGNDPNLCILPSSMLEREGIELGDTVRFLAGVESRSRKKFAEYEFLVVGSYVLPWGKETLYTPFTFNFPEGAEVYEMPVVEHDPDYSLTGTYDIEWTSRMLDTNTFRSMIFTLKDTTDLDSLRVVVGDSGFAGPKSPGTIRSYAVIDDAEYLSTVKGLERQIKYTDALYKCLYVLIMLLGAVAAYLLLNSRKSEIAIMRAIGSPIGRIVLNFMAEQLLLSLVGMAAGIVVWYFLNGNINADLLRMALYFEGFWLAGALLRLVFCLMIKARDLLSEQE